MALHRKGQPAPGTDAENAMQRSKLSKTELFEKVSIPRALAAMGIPTIISQLINLIYNIVDAFFIGRTSCRS